MWNAMRTDGFGVYVSLNKFRGKEVSREMFFGLFKDALKTIRTHVSEEQARITMESKKGLVFLDDDGTQTVLMRAVKPVPFINFEVPHALGVLYPNSKCGGMICVGTISDKQMESLTRGRKFPEVNTPIEGIAHRRISSISIPAK